VTSWAKTIAADNHIRFFYQRNELIGMFHANFPGTNRFVDQIGHWFKDRRCNPDNVGTRPERSKTGKVWCTLIRAPADHKHLPTISFMGILPGFREQSELSGPDTAFGLKGNANVHDRGSPDFGAVERTDSVNPHTGSRDVRSDDPRS
jgi:hypothetical protein